MLNDITNSELLHRITGKSFKEVSRDTHTHFRFSTMDTSTASGECNNGWVTSYEWIHPARMVHQVVKKSYTNPEPQVTYDLLMDAPDYTSEGLKKKSLHQTVTYGEAW